MTASTQNPVTLINVFEVDPQNQARLVALLQENTETVIMTLEGWISTELIASADGRQVVIHSRWQTSDNLAAMRTDPRMLAYFPRIAELAALTSIAGQSVVSHHV